MALRSEVATRPPLAGRKCLFESNIADIAHFIYEVPTNLLAPYLPRGVVLVEPRPGIALLDLGYVSWAPGNWDHWPAFHEVTLLALVQPDLSFPMPLPKFSFFALNICSNFQGFLDTEPDQLRLLSFRSELAVKFSGEPYDVAIRDESGPLARLRSTQAVLTYEPVDYVGQYFSVRDGTLYMGLWQWAGLAAEHQAPGDAGQMFNHRLFRGMNVEAHRDPYLQLICKPGAGSLQRFYQPFPIGPAVYEFASLDPR